MSEGICSRLEKRPGDNKGAIAANVLHRLGPGREGPAAQMCSRQSRDGAGRAGRVDGTAAAGRSAPAEPR